MVILCRAGSLAAFCLAAFSCSLAPCSEERVVLDTSGFWRFWLTLRTPVVRDGATISEVGAKCDTLSPPEDWAGSAFDDSGWARVCGAPFATWSHWEPAARANVGFIYCHGSSLALAQLCLRGKFQVDDPANARGLKLSLTFRGGAAVYVNGTELARKHLPQGPLGPQTHAEMYPREAYYLEDGRLPEGYGGKGSNSPRLLLRLRTLEVEIPPEALKKGTNVLAISLHRCPLPADVFADLNRLKDHKLPYVLWDACGLYSARLATPADCTVKANATRPSAVQAWNSSLLATDTDVDWGDPLETLRPIRIVGARNGAFSGKILLGSDEPLKDLKASVSDLSGPAGTTIPASAVTLRYAAADLTQGPVKPSVFDSLLETPPAETPVRRKTVSGDAVRRLPGEPAPVYGSVVPVWLTVKVPADAGPGQYGGTLTAGANGKVFTIPVELRVSDFGLPDPKDYRTFVELVQSPDTLAAEYNLPLWSDAHWRLIEKSLALVAEAGAKTCYVPLICETNLGNEQSMVRWLPQGENKYSHDLRIMDKYLDLVARRLGPSALVCFYAWDNFLEGGQFGGDIRFEAKATQDDRLAYRGKGPAVTMVEGTDVKRLLLPQYSDPAARPLWEGLAKELRSRMRERGMERAMLLGLATDAVPAPAVVDFWKELLPGVNWASQAHPFREKIHGVPVALTSAVWAPRFIAYDGTSRQGWKNPRLMLQFARDLTDLHPLTLFRLIGEHNVGGDQRGFARFGADFWPVLRDRRGERASRITDRYPRASWRNLNIKTALLGPGPDGPVATARFEVLREGIQQCEARIFIEQAMDDGRLPDELRARCRELIAQRNRALVMGISPHNLEGFVDAAAYARVHDWHGLGKVGYYWYLTSGWQERSGKLYDLAATVAEELRRKDREPRLSAPVRSGATSRTARAGDD